MKKTAANSVGSRQYSEATIMRLGRTLRRFSRTSRELMKILDIKEDAVRIPRKKKRPATSRVAKKQEEQKAEA